MTFSQIVKEIDTLDDLHIRRLLSHLVLRRIQQNDEYLDEIRNRLSDGDLGNWAALEAEAGKQPPLEQRSACQAANKLPLFNISDGTVA